MLSCVSCVPNGAAQAHPKHQQLSGAELDMLVKQQEALSLGGGEDEDGMEEGAEGAPEKRLSEEEFMAKMNMDQYDDEPEGATLFLGGKNLTFHTTNQEDPYITLPDKDAAFDSEDEDDMIIRKTDKLILCGRTEEEHSTMEVYVYDEGEGGLYVHHDFHLPSFPLCMTWLDQNPTEPAQNHGNLVAVGTFQPGIEIWDIDVLDALEPVATLGGRHAPDAAKAKALQKKYKGKNRHKLEQSAKLKEILLGKLKAGSHADAVMSLDWHKLHRNRLASASADTTVKLWDVMTQECTATLNLHKDKVQVVRWNPAEASMLLTGSYDQTVCLGDVRNSQSTKRTPVLRSDVESACWNPMQPFQFMVSTENGEVCAFDARNLEKPLFRLAAHNGAASSVSVSAHRPGLMATAGTDKTVKLWNIADNQPKMITSKDMKIGPIFCMSLDQTHPNLLVAGGNNGNLAVWDVAETVDGSAPEKQ